MVQSILICEDDPALGQALQTLLRNRGYRISLVREGHEALARVAQDPPALLLLDLCLPDMDGFDVCRRLRGQCPVPIMMISGRGGEVDRIVGLEVGADAYLVKPFGANELVARIEAQLRRADRAVGAQRLAAGTDIGELHLNLEAHQVLRAGQDLSLTPKEFELLAALAEHRGSVVRSRQLLLQVWGYDASIRTRTLDVHIGRLRAKIEADTRHPRYILTVPGIGYKLCAPDDASAAA